MNGFVHRPLSRTSECMTPFCLDDIQVGLVSREQRCFSFTFSIRYVRCGERKLIYFWLRSLRWESGVDIFMNFSYCAAVQTPVSQISNECCRCCSLDLRCRWKYTVDSRNCRWTVQHSHLYASESQQMRLCLLHVGSSILRSDNTRSSAASTYSLWRIRTWSSIDEWYLL